MNNRGLTWSPEELHKKQLADCNQTLSETDGYFLWQLQ